MWLFSARIIGVSMEPVVVPRLHRMTIFRAAVHGSLHAARHFSLDMSFLTLYT